jgi:uncharacterized protein YdeI (YjbR/CyaY-like superfamily)
MAKILIRIYENRQKSRNFTIDTILSLEEIASRLQEALRRAMPSEQRGNAVKEDRTVTQLPRRAPACAQREVSKSEVKAWT